MPRRSILADETSSRSHPMKKHAALLFLALWTSSHQEDGAAGIRVRTPRDEQADLQKQAVHCSADPDFLARIGSAKGHQVLSNRHFLLGNRRQVVREAAVMGH